MLVQRVKEFGAKSKYGVSSNEEGLLGDLRVRFDVVVPHAKLEHLEMRMSYKGFWNTLWWQMLIGPSPEQLEMKREASRQGERQHGALGSYEMQPHKWQRYKQRNQQGNKDMDGFSILLTWFDSPKCFKAPDSMSIYSWHYLRPCKKLRSQSHDWKQKAPRIPCYTYPFYNTWHKRFSLVPHMVK